MCQLAVLYYMALTYKHISKWKIIYDKVPDRKRV